VTEIRLNISPMFVVTEHAGLVPLTVKFIHRNLNFTESRTVIDTVASVFVTEAITVLALEHTSAPDLPSPPPLLLPPPWHHP
jgi:hypothetical protein